MASVFLNFIPPNDVPDMKILHIYEAPAVDGPYGEIEQVTEIGNPGRYITSYTTDQAVSETDWFAIQWENDKGALSELSAGVQGGATNIVSEIVERCLLRDPYINEQVAAQEAAAVVEMYYGTITPDMSTVTNQELSGLTLLTMARCYLVTIYSPVQTVGQKYTAGLISQDMGSATVSRSLKDIEALINAANMLLGRNYSAILLMKQIEVGGRYTALVDMDVTRSIIDVEVGVLPTKPAITFVTGGGGNGSGGDINMGEQIPPGGDPGDVLRRVGPEELAWTPPPNVLWGVWQFATQTANANPGGGRIRLNNASYALVTEIYISRTTQPGVDASTPISGMVADNSIRIQDKTDATRSANFGLTGPAVQSSDFGYYILPVTFLESSGNLFGNNGSVAVVLTFDVLTGATP